MMSTFRRAFLLAIILLAPEVLGLQVTPNSPCASTCMDDVSDNVSDPNSSNTVPSDIVCADADYTNVAAGRKYEACVNCLRNSTVSSDGEDDQSWFLCEFALQNHFNRTLTISYRQHTIRPGFVSFRIHGCYRR